MAEIIEYPKKRSEAEIQAVLFYFLRKRKIDARLQVTAVNPRTGKKSCKMDIVIFVDKQAECIIECKSWSPKYARVEPYRKSNNSRQVNKYRSFYEIPVFVCGRINHINQTIDEVLKRVRLV